MTGRRERVTRIAEAAQVVVACVIGGSIRLWDILCVTASEIVTAIERAGSPPISDDERIVRLLELQARRAGAWGHDEARAYAERADLSSFPAEARKSLAGIQAELNRRLWRDQVAEAFDVPADLLDLDPADRDPPTFTREEIEASVMRAVEASGVPAEYREAAGRQALQAASPGRLTAEELREPPWTADRALAELGRRVRAMRDEQS